MNDALVRRVAAAFLLQFGEKPTVMVQAPGRVNLIGEHTDYNDGFVLPCAIDFGTVIAASPRDDSLVRVVAADYGNAEDEFLLDRDIVHRPDAQWANYIRGMCQVLVGQGLALRGAEFAIGGNVPQGAGLSSSASLEVATGQAFKSLQQLGELDPTRLALAAQKAENAFVGVNCGIMDQLISARGEDGHALLIDCRSLSATPVPLPAGAVVMIVNSRVRRGLVDSKYNERRQQCEAAARHFGVKALRDVTSSQLEAGGAGLDPVVLRRARHIVTENARTTAAAQALAAGDLRTMGTLMAESHRSMRDDFEITVPAVDDLVEILQEVAGTRGGARMTGGGFGGCVVALLPQDLAESARAAVLERYRSPEGEAADVWACRAAVGAGALAAPY